jgi:hypothetical protein
MCGFRVPSIVPAADGRFRWQSNTMLLHELHHRLQNLLLEDRVALEEVLNAHRDPYSIAAEDLGMVLNEELRSVLLADSGDVGAAVDYGGVA